MIRKRWIWFAVTIVLILGVVTIWKVANVSKEKVVYVFSDSCGYCSSFSPKFDKVVKEFPGWTVEKLDIQQPGELDKATKLGAEVTPTVFLLNADKVVDKLEGDVSEEVLRKFFEKNVSGPSS